MPEPLIVSDGRENWVVYPEDAAYRLLADKPPNGNGVIGVEPSLLAQVKGWWYEGAAERIATALASLEIPWDELTLTEEEARASEITLLVERLARLSYYSTKVSREMAGIDIKLSLAKNALEHAVNRLIALERGKGAMGPQAALLISKDKRLRNAKIETMEADAAKKGLANFAEALDINWKTVSRALSARLREPIE